MKKLKLTQGKVALLDDEDFEYLSQWKWQFRRRYASRVKYLGGGRLHNRGTTITLHRLLMEFYNNNLSGKEVDHINGDTLDNRKENLRVVFHQNNCFNQNIPKNNTTGFKGVVFNKQAQKYQAYITKDKRIHLGYFNSLLEAANAYNEKAKVLFGEYAKLNIIK